jgi:thioredoxin reductase (NADPH)
VRNKDTGETEKLAVQGLFLYVGEVPNLSFLKIDGLTDEKGYLITDGRRETKQKNLFAIGDCRDTTLRQIVTAAGDGALAATSVHDTYQQSPYTK